MDSTRHPNLNMDLRGRLAYFDRDNSLKAGCALVE